jgi:RHS repeat-associated protein
VTLAKSYEPYGSVLNSSGSASSIFAYAGEEFDTTGLIYLRARYMQPRLGIFTSRDPWDGDVMRPGSLNGWNYAEGNPVNRVDPSGNDPRACNREPRNILDVVKNLRCKERISRPRPLPAIPDFNLDDLFPFNGYIEGVTFIGQVASQYITIFGKEIVYDFVTHERAEFTFQGYTIFLASCGVNLGTAWEGSANPYVGTFDFTGYDEKEWQNKKETVPQRVFLKSLGCQFQHPPNAGEVGHCFAGRDGMFKIA